MSDDCNSMQNWRLEKSKEKIHASQEEKDLSRESLEKKLEAKKSKKVEISKSKCPVVVYTYIRI